MREVRGLVGRERTRYVFYIIMQSFDFQGFCVAISERRKEF